MLDDFDKGHVSVNNFLRFFTQLLSNLWPTDHKFDTKSDTLPCYQTVALIKKTTASDAVSFYNFHDRMQTKPF